MRASNARVLVGGRSYRVIEATVRAAADATAEMMYTGRTFPPTTPSATDVAEVVAGSSTRARGNARSVRALTMRAFALAQRQIRTKHRPRTHPATSETPRSRLSGDPPPRAAEYLATTVKN